MFQPFMAGDVIPAAVVRVRLAEARDEHLAEITAIYRHGVSTGTSTYEDPLPDEGEMAQRLEAVRTAGLPAFVALGEEGRVLGFAWARPFRERAGYRLSVENSIYVAANARRQGVGSLLLEKLIQACRALGCRRMVAVIGDARNAASIALHRDAGFETVGFFPGLGVRPRPEGGLEEVDVLMMQRCLAGSNVVGHA
ncbi:phosphinothricin acetyltransferase [Arboricoccus pini]|uniref:Phosphinothricin acetyltransferase n=1 Tax=Arboricoccus pini TaxID=1963835 RepID=A0A212PZN6_9PROT|nr:GNAT family N-acetyltransferase [Arboricoccus pini]SNB52408.1 phosphinothricin acetyltransferase [Arboricoccus pini]